MPSAEEHWTDMHFVARIVSTHDPVVCVKNNKLPVPKVCKEIMKADAEWNTDLKINEATCKRIFSKMILMLRDFVNEPHSHSPWKQTSMLNTFLFHLSESQSKYTISICNSSLKFIKNKHNFHRLLNVIPYEG